MRYGPISIFLVALPFLFSRATSDPFHALRWAFLAFGALASLAMLARRPAQAFLPAPVPALIAVWLAASAFSWIPALDKAEAAWQAIRDAAWAAWFVALLATARRHAGFPVLVRRAALLAAAVGAAVAIGQYWNAWLPGSHLGYGPGGLQGNRNLLASLQLLFAPWIIWGLVDERGPWRMAAWIAWSGFAYAMAVTQCRAAWLGAAAMAVSLGLIALSSRHPAAKPRKGLLAGAALVVFAAFVFHGFFRPASDTRVGSLERAASLADASDASAAQRLALWGKTGRLIAMHPGLGVGGGNWKLAVLGEGLGGTLWPDMQRTETRPYDDWLWTAAEIGIPGALGWLGLWVFALACGLRAARRGPSGSRMPAALLSAGLIGFAALSAFDFPRERPEHMAWLAATLAVLIASSPKPLGAGFDPMSAHPASAPGFSRLVFAAFALTALATGGASLWRWRNEAVIKDLLDAQRRHDWPAVLACGARLDRTACDLNPAGSPAAWHTGMARWEAGDARGAEADFRAALRLSPWHTHLLYDLSVVRLAGGDTLEAESLLRRALATSPGFAPASINLAAVSLRRGRGGEARAILGAVPDGGRDGNWRRLDGMLAVTERGNR